MSGYTKSVFIQ